MLESYVGADAFRKGVNAYLEKHKYANATSEDFLGAVGAASGKPVDRVIGTFVLQAGVPEVDVSTSCANGRTSVTVSQRPFTLDAASEGARERWQIPICLKTAGDGQPSCLVFSEPVQTTTIGDGCAPWVFANAGGKGYYRTSYAPEMIKQLARDAEGSLSGPERLSLISDEWALVRAGRHSIASYLDLVSAFGRESAAEVLGAIGDRLATINSELTDEVTRPKFKAFVRTLLEPAYQALGFDRGASDSEDSRTRRNVILGALGLVADDADVVEKARRAVSNALDGSAPLDPIVAGTLVSIAAAHGDAAMFDAYKAAVSQATNPQDYYRYLYALTSFRDPALVQRALEYR